MNLRVPIAAAAAVVLASLSLSLVLAGNGWLGAGIGAVIVVAATGFATRTAGLRLALTATGLVLIAAVPLLFGHGWPRLVTGLVLVAATAASATGVRWLRSFAAGAAYLAALLIYLNLVFAPGPSIGHVIPPSDASVAQLGRMISAAFAQFRNAPPIPDTRPVSLVGAGGIGLVAIMVDILAVRMRRPAVAGLPLLVLFSVPIASSIKNYSPLQAATFAAGMTGFLTLLSTASRERLRKWGRLVTFRYIQPLDETGGGPDTRELAASGRRIGLAAVCLAVIIPVILPVVRTHALFGSTGTGSSGHGLAGSGSGIGLDAMLGVQHQLQEKSPQPVLTYTTSATLPAQQYFQVYVLNYNGAADTWLPQFSGHLAYQSPASSRLPYPPQGQLPSTPATTVRTTITLTAGQGEPGVAGFIPAPYAPVKLKTSTAGWAELAGSLMLYNPSVLLGGLRYTVTSSEADPAAADITSLTAHGVTPDAILKQYGAYTGPDTARLAAIARQHIQSAQTQLQAALDLQAWFLSGGFSYTLKPDLPASHWLLTFLTTQRRGYCQQFAWAFAILARLVGIPSRIAVGFTGGAPGLNGTWQITTADAHAWPELYFANVGWLRFEPTPHGGKGQGTATLPAYASIAAGGGQRTPAAGASPGTHGPAGAATAGNRAGLNRFAPVGTGGGAQPGAAAGTGLWLAIVLPVLGLALVSGPAMIRRLTRRRRWLSASTDAAAAAVAWRELTDDLADYGLDRGPGETPRALARRITKEADLGMAAAQAIGRIAAAAERAQYARLAPPSAGLAAEVARARRGIAASVPRPRRVRAWLLPASTLTAAQEKLRRAGDMLSWLDTSWPALRQQLRRGQLDRTS